MSAHRVPLDVCVYILTFASQDTLRTSTWICKEWRPYATRLLFKDVELNTFRQVKAFVHRLQAPLVPSPSIRTLRITRDAAAIFLFPRQLIPELETITFAGDWQEVPWWRLLKSIPLLLPNGSTLAKLVIQGSIDLSHAMRLVSSLTSLTVLSCKIIHCETKRPLKMAFGPRCRLKSLHTGVDGGNVLYRLATICEQTEILRDLEHLSLRANFLVSGDCMNHLLQLAKVSLRVLELEVYSLKGFGKY